MQYQCKVSVIAICQPADFATLQISDTPGRSCIVFQLWFAFVCLLVHVTRTENGRTIFAKAADGPDYVLPSGASLKLSILNPKGRIWTMVAGGGKHVSHFILAIHTHTSNVHGKPGATHEHHSKLMLTWSAGIFYYLYTLSLRAIAGVRIAIRALQ